MDTNVMNPYLTSCVDTEPDIAAGDNDLATRIDRLGGAVADGLILIVAFFAISVLVGAGAVVMGIDIERMNYVRYRPLGQFMQTSATFVMFLLLNARSLATRGQTWGKRMARTRIVSNDGKLLPLSRLILRRYVPYFFMGCIPLAGVILVWADMLAIFRRNHKCLHDELAGTKVVKVGFVGR